MVKNLLSRLAAIPIPPPPPFLLLGRQAGGQATYELSPVWLSSRSPGTCCTFLSPIEITLSKSSARCPHPCHCLPGARCARRALTARPGLTSLRAAGRPEPQLPLFPWNLVLNVPGRCLPAARSSPEGGPARDGDSRTKAQPAARSGGRHARRGTDPPSGCGYALPRGEGPAGPGGAGAPPAPLNRREGLPQRRAPPAAAAPLTFPLAEGI